MSSRRRFFIHLTLLLTLTVFATYLIVQQLERTNRQTLDQKHIQLIKAASRHIQQQSNHFLSTSLLIYRALTVINKAPLPNTLPSELSSLVQDTQALTNLTWMSDNGTLLLAINNRGTIETENPKASPSPRLQHFQQQLMLSNSHYWLSPLFFNVDLEQWTTSVAIRTGTNDSMATGLIIFDYSLNHLLEDLAIFTGENFLLSVLYDNPYNINSTHGERAQLNIFYDVIFSRYTWGALKQKINNAQGVFTRADGRFHWSMAPLIMLPVQSPSIQANTDASYLLIATNPKEYGKQKRNIWFWAIVIGSTFVFVTTGFTLFSYRREEELALHNFAIQKDRQKLSESNKQLAVAYQQQQVLQNQLVENRKLSALSYSIAAMAHDINTPAGGALLSLATLQQRLANLPDNSDTQALAEGLSLTEKQVKRVLDLVKNYKNLAFEQSTREVSATSLHSLIENLLVILKPLLSKHSVKVRNQTDAHVVLNTVPSVLTQVLQNLITNAIAHAFKDQTSRLISINCELNTGGYITLSVSDNGHGIAPDLLDHIFEPFFTSHRGQDHNGLGLFMVQRWVTEALKGRISVSSHSGGTRFVITLPKNLSSKESEAAPVEESSFPPALNTPESTEQN